MLCNTIIFKKGSGVSYYNIKQIAKAKPVYSSSEREADFYNYMIYNVLNINGRQFTGCRLLLESLNFAVFILPTQIILLKSFRFTPVYND